MDNKEELKIDIKEENLPNLTLNMSNNTFWGHFCLAIFIIIGVK
jgi:hypothetical protein